MAVRHPSKVIIRVRISLAALFYLNAPAVFLLQVHVFFQLNIHSKSTLDINM